MLLSISATIQCYHPVHAELHVMSCLRPKPRQNRMTHTLLHKCHAQHWHLALCQSCPSHLHLQETAAGLSHCSYRKLVALQGLGNMSSSLKCADCHIAS